MRLPVPALRRQPGACCTFPCTTPASASPPRAWTGSSNRSARRTPPPPVNTAAPASASPSASGWWNSWAAACGSRACPQKGSVFNFRIPFHPGEAPVPSDLQGPQPQLADLRVLIVDDNPTNRRILTLQTSKWAMIPRAAESGAEALEWLRQGESFDLAILDMQMPEMDGLMLAREIRKLPGTVMLPLVLLTSMGVRADNPGICRRFLRQLPDQAHQARPICTRRWSASFPAPNPPSKQPSPANSIPSLAGRLPLARPALRRQCHQPEGRPAPASANGLQGRCRRQRAGMSAGPRTAAL